MMEPSAQQIPARALPRRRGTVEGEEVLESTADPRPAYNVSRYSP